MDEGSWLSIIFLVLLLAGAIYFAIAETAFVSVSKPRIRAQQEMGEKRADKALRVLDDLDRAITTILIGTNIMHLFAAAIVTVLVTKYWGTGAVVWGTVFTTLVLFFVGELLPKTFAKRYSERSCLATAGALCFFMRIFTPLSALLTAIGQAVSRAFRGEGEVSVTEEELHDIIEDMTDAGSLNEEQGDLIQSALDFGDIPVESVLTARVDMAAIDASWPIERVTEFVCAQRHSRLPVYQDQPDDIIGILQIRKYMKAWCEQGPQIDLRSLLDTPYFVPATATVGALLQELSTKRLNMAVVTDAWGGTLGIITVEDILEELVGEIWDEEDEVTVYYRALEGGQYEIDASVYVSEAFGLMHFRDPECNEDLLHKPLNEWALERFGLMPSQRDRFLYHDLEFTVSDMRQHRIRKLTVRRLPEAQVAAGGEGS